ncbi:hypothetical protein DL96DRAFT_420935 [Flagelloscypha sp. PMI_526]|nr:hypothetical protein DL96DRAFT_420935 [Flagelloscypha sp. PMI_526]
MQTFSRATLLDVPHEIQLLIFTFVFKGENESFIRKTRLICCRICRSMLAFHQAALFASVELVRDYTWTPNRPCRILTFHRTISESARLGRLVRTVVIQLDAYSVTFPAAGYGSNLSNTLAMLPPLLPNVYELRLNGKWLDRLSCREFMLQALKFWRPTLRTLFVEDISRRPFPELLFGWEALEYLDLNNAESAFFRSHYPDQPLDTAIEPGPRLFSFTATPKMLQQRKPMQNHPLPFPVPPDSEELSPSVECAFSLKTLTLHFQPKHVVYSPSCFNPGSDLLRLCGPTLSKLHITGNSSGFTAAPSELPSLKCLRIEILPIFVEPGPKSISLIWLIQFVRQRSSAGWREIGWNLKEVELDALWFPMNKTMKLAVLVQLQELARAFSELNESVPKVSIVTRWNKVGKWEGLIRDVEGIKGSVRGQNVL